MIPLPRHMVLSKVPHGELRFDLRPIQWGMRSDPWHVAVASILLCRSRRVQVEPVLKRLLYNWPTPALLCASDIDELQAIVRPCGLHRNRSRQLQRFSCNYLAEWWNDFRDLPGVGRYVADAVGLFCFKCLEVESDDGALKAAVSQAEHYTEGEAWPPDGVFHHGVLS